eukprot:9479979-Pyramimonas_sp.AAC.1
MLVNICVSSPPQTVIAPRGSALYVLFHPKAVLALMFSRSVRLIISLDNIHRCRIRCSVVSRVAVLFISPDSACDVLSYGVLWGVLWGLLGVSYGVLWGLLWGLHRVSNLWEISCYRMKALS